jgi:hypothetical protein
MKITPGNYKTRSGKKVTVVATGLRSVYPVLGYFHHKDFDAVSHWHSDGKYHMDRDSTCDLVERIGDI